MACKRFALASAKCRRMKEFVTQRRHHLRQHLRQVEDFAANFDLGGCSGVLQQALQRANQRPPGLALTSSASQP